jgi:hypothetical protein
VTAQAKQRTACVVDFDALEADGHVQRGVGTCRVAGGAAHGGWLNTRFCAV